jgi:hypothetical protein
LVGLEIVEADAVGRRQFLALTGMMLTSAAREWLFDLVWVVVFLHGKRIGHELIDDLERVVETKRHGDDAIGGGALLPLVREDVRLVVSMLRNAVYLEDVGRRLHGVAAGMGAWWDGWPMTLINMRSLNGSGCVRRTRAGSGPPAPTCWSS